MASRFGYANYRLSKLSLVPISSDNRCSTVVLFLSNTFLIMPTSCRIFIDYIHLLSLSPACFGVTFNVVMENLRALYLKACFVTQVLGVVTAVFQCYNYGKYNFAFFTMVSIGFFIDIILPAPLWSTQPLNRNE